MPVLNRGEVALHYEVEGHGPPLLMIAGMCSDSASWAPLVPLLSGRFTLIRPDNRTTGRTTPWDAPVGLAEYARDCVALLDELQIDKVHVVGHSMGGMVALHLAQTLPERIERATLLAAAPVRLARNLALFEALVRIRESDAAPDLWLRSFFPWLFAPAVFEEPGAIDAAIAGALAYPHAQSAAAMRHQLSALRDHVPSTAAPIIPVRALLAEDDLILPLHVARAAFAALPQVEVTTIAAAGHSLHWDQPGVIAGLLT